MISNYKILFAINLLNDYYKNGLCSNFRIIPSAETALLLKKQQLLYKNIDNRIVILTRLKSSANPADDGKPFLPIAPATKFVFYLSLQKPEFTSFTNLHLEALRTQRLYCTNLNQNKHLTFAHLTSAIDAYKNTTPYIPGDFADDGTKKIFECIKTTTGNDTTNASFWVSRDDVQYVSPKDFIQPLPTIFNYEAPVAATEFNVSVFELDTVINQYTKIVSAQTLKYNEATKNIQIDLSALKVRQGKYRITINGDDIVFYADDEFLNSGYFGVVEIFSHLPAANDFTFLDAQGKPIEKDYYIRFANRLATWKYITPKNGVTGITHPASKYTFTPHPLPPPSASYFESDKPIPLTQFPEELRLQLFPKISSGAPRAPGPDVSVPGVITKTVPDNDYYCNIYLNY